MDQHSRRESPVRLEEAIAQFTGSSRTTLRITKDNVNQGETAKRSLASHYTISRDETSLGSSVKDKLHALRKAGDNEQYMHPKQMIFPGQSQESNNPLSSQDTLKDFDFDSFLNDDGKNDDSYFNNDDRQFRAALNALSHPFAKPENQPDSLVSFLQEKVKELHSENERLLHRRMREDKLDANFEVLHHISSEIGTETYLETPYWAKTSKGIQLKANSPILYPDAYIQYKSLEFIVERYYSGDKEAAPEVTEALRQNQIPDPIPSWEYLRPVSKDMREAIKLLRKGEDPRKISGSLKDEVMVAPYYWWYCYRDQPDIFDTLSRAQEKLIRNLTDWIEANYSELYSRIDSQFERGMVSAASMSFLVRPGDVLVRMDQDSVEAYLASSSLDVINKENFRVRMSEDHLSSSDEFARLHAATPPTKKVQTEWEVNAWSYIYNGNFSKQTKKLSITFSDDTENTEIPVQDLSVFPLRFASLELRESLEQRGKTFWSCRYRKYISYAKETKEEHSVSYSKTLRHLDIVLNLSTGRAALYDRLFNLSRATSSIYR